MLSWGGKETISLPKLIYFADDEENMRLLVKSFLENEGYEVRLFSNGSDIRHAFDNHVPDLIILDVMMPGEDGLSVCSYIRHKSSVPIIIISAKDTPLDKAAGIMLGSDDYIAKPFLPLELIARIKALFRRIDMSFQPESNSYSCGNLTLYPAARKICVNEAAFNATPTEYEFLLYMLKKAGAAVSKQELLKAVWKYSDTSDSRVIDDLNKRLRKKLREADSTAVLETVWGYGYKLASYPGSKKENPDYD